MNEAQPKKARVTKKRDVRIHAELWATSDFLLHVGQQEQRGSAHQFRASLVFRAFALEAFLNWLGQQLIPHWNYLERLNPKQKLDLLADLVHVRPDYGSRPWQVVKDIFGFRNDIAHGKPLELRSERYEVVDEFLDEKLGQFIRTNWERFCTAENASRAQEDVHNIAASLYEAAKLKHAGPLGPFSPGFQIHGAKL